MLESLADRAAFLAQDVWNLFVQHFGHREWWQWFLFFMPFYVFGEFPRYVLPAMVLGIRRAFRLDRDDEEAKRRFLEERPAVSVLLVGYNEEASVANAIRSLLELGWPGIEIIVVDDGSTDRMYEEARPFAEAGKIKLFRNTAATGRGGRPAASNLALHMATGRFILSVDADTSFDRDALEHMIGPFYDPRVGCVAGNLKVRNVRDSLWTRMQAMEYLLSIGLWKRWLNLLGMNMQASGAFGAFRRETLEAVGAWDSELAEDADLSLKIKKAGWKIVFAPRAIALTSVPVSRTAFTAQRHRWDKGTLRTYIHKHGDILRFWRYDWRNAFEVAMTYFFEVFMTFLYAIWLGIMLWNWAILLPFIFAITYVLYAGTTFMMMLVALAASERRSRERFLLLWVPLFAIYKGYSRWVRFFALTLEYLRINYEEYYLPASAWRNAPKW
ncbi:MAG: glycosyltransferase [Planctomycetota bacterium]